MNRQDVVNTIYEHYLENYDHETAVEALKFLGVSEEEIVGAVLDCTDPDQAADCICGHPKKDHHMGPKNWSCKRGECDCLDFKYAKVVVIR